MKKTTLIVSLLCLCVWAISASAENKRVLPEGHLLPPRPPKAGVIQPQVAQGDPAKAKAYYNGLRESLKLPKPTTVQAPAGSSDPTIFNPDFTLQTILDWAGYQGLLALDLERLTALDMNEPEVLAAKISNPGPFNEFFSTTPIGEGDILATRYFSPKITDVSGLTPGNELKYGFRKVIRLKTRAGSVASDPAVGIDAVWLLFNYFVAVGDLGREPLKQGPSVNIQIMATRPWPSTIAGAKPSYWMVFDQAKDGKHSLIGHLNATFDARDPEVVANSPNPVKEYYVPNACAQCHGGKDTGKLNFLDSDHWFNRVNAGPLLPGNDFPEYASSPHGVLVEGGKDTASAAFKRAFADIRALNQAIEKQNTSVDNGFQTQAVKKWLDIHATSDAFFPPSLRGVGVPEKKWRADNLDDHQTIELLDRYCYRCHSSVKYNVYEKQAVIDNKADILDDLDNGRMPQDRLLKQEEIDQLKALIQKLP